MGLRLWNVLPRDINSIVEADKFKKSLTTWLLSLPDKPPVHGYARANNNSLVEVATFSNNRGPWIVENSWRVGGT